MGTISNQGGLPAKNLFGQEKTLTGKDLDKYFGKKPFLQKKWNRINLAFSKGI